MYLAWRGRAWYGWVFPDGLKNIEEYYEKKCYISRCSSDIQTGYIPEGKWRKLHSQGKRNFHALCEDHSHECQQA